MALEPEQIQRDYYTRTAVSYDASHVHDEDGEHFKALRLIDSLCDQLEIKTLVDVGAGTGRGVSFFLDRGRDAKGIELVPALIEQSEVRGVPKGAITEGSGYSLPFADSSVDAAFECGVLHHVADPSRMIAEMMRVSSKAVFISDCNRFGRGSSLSGLLKLVLYRAHLWNAFWWISNRGKRYAISEGDGLYYSYSVYDSYAQLAAWAREVYFLPIGETKKGWLHPLLTSSHVLLCAIR